MISFIRKYRHGFVILVFSIIYMLLFSYLEQRGVRYYHVVHTALDDRIPFCEVFIIPYLLWFPYMIAAILYFVFLNDDKKEYYRLTWSLIMGMSLFLVISWLYPNIQHLRPTVFPRENVFTDMVRALYRTDTPTNILPSIHVFNSLAIHMAISSCQRLRKHRFVQAASLVLTILIVMSTMFLKQHSVVDVSMGTALSIAAFFLFYSEWSVVRDPVANRQKHTYTH
ncbi:MAG: phosphatase PAP2 family protein [Blautia sp.]|nr:phosphatase PAP2 family protein [Blautia sp.]